MLALTLDALRLLIAAAGLAAFAWGLRRRRSTLSERWRRGLLVVLAVAALAAYYNFFLYRHFGTTKDGDAFTYYVGSKYFSELGYFDLYDCTVAALVDLELRDRPQGASVPLVLDLPEVRDLRTLEIQTSGELLGASGRCRSSFENDRWAGFVSDVDWFRDHTHPASWPLTFLDHGYHPTPVWTLAGGSLANLTAAGDPGFLLLVLADCALIVLLLAAVAWAFDLEVACLAAIVWGTGHLWSYAWIGDSYLRNLWLAAAIAGLACLRRECHFAAGALLALASLLRLFPGAFAAAFLLHAARRSWTARRITAPARRFVLGLAAGSVVLLAATIVASGRGLDDYRGFADKISVFADTEFSNTVGLPVLARQLETANAEPHPERTRFLVGALRLALIGWLLAMFWKTLPRIGGWQAAALGFAWIPMLAAPANYYHSFVLAAALLAAERRRIAVLLLAAGAAWLSLALLLPDYLTDPSHQLLDSHGASLVAVIFAFLVVRQMSTSEDDPPAGRELGD